MSYIEERQRRESELSDTIRKVINESECTYGEAISVLHMLMRQYQTSSRNVVIRTKSISHSEKE